MRARSLPSGATLLYGPRSPRPDLVLAAQFLIDDLRAEGQRIGSLRVNDQTLRLRLDGLELALALSASPLPLDQLGTAPRLAPGSATVAEAGFTDLGQIRTLRALRQHRLALGVLLRRRGAGPEDLDAALHPILLSLIEAAPPGVILWQATGAVWPVPQFRAARPEALAGAGPRLPPLGPPDGSEARPAAPVPAPAPRSRAERRSAGRLFEGGGRPAVLPRIEPAMGRVASALRGEDAEAPGPAPERPGRRLVVLALAVWALLGLPSWPGLQAMLP